MNKAILLILFIPIFQFSIYGQTFEWVTEMVGSDVYGRAIASDKNGNSFVTGVFAGNAKFGSFNLYSSGMSDIFLTKYDNSGNILWAVKAGGGDLDDAYGVSLDPFGNIYITGCFEYTATFGSIVITGSEYWDMFIAKYDSSGNCLWVKKGGGPSGLDMGLGISIDNYGNNYVVGRFDGIATFGTFVLTSSGQSDIFIAKYDTSGNCLWAKKSGGSSGDDGLGVKTDIENNCYITGAFSGTASIGDTVFTSFGSYDICIIKYNSNGDILWVKRYGEIGDDRGLGISTDNFGNSYTTGLFYQTISFGNHTLTSSGIEDIFIAKHDRFGNCLWAKKSGGPSVDNPHGISTDSSGNSYIVGFFGETAFFDTITYSSYGSSDIFVSKYDNSGNISWVKRSGGPGSEHGYGISVSSNGHIYTTGLASGNAVFGNFTLLNNCGFTSKIMTSTIELTSPNGGETWQTGTSQNITWNSNNITNARIEYSTDNGVKWNNVTASITASYGFFTWTIPNTPSTKCKIRISDASNSAVFDISDSVFTIPNSSIALTTLNGGENLESYGHVNITWTSNYVSNVKIQYTSNNGLEWKTIKTTIPAATGIFSWTVPNTPSIECMVRIYSLEDQSICDSSDNNFSIYNNTSWTLYNQSNSSLPSNYINAIVVDESGIKWIGSQFGGLTKFNGTTWETFTPSNSGLPNIFVTSIAIDDSGNKWIGTYGGGLARYDNQNWVVYNIDNSNIPDNNINAVVIGENGNIWVATVNGLGKFNGSNWNTFNTSNSGLPSNHLWSAAIDEIGNIWTGSRYEGGLSKYNGSNWTTYTPSNSGLPNTSIRSIAIDGNGNKWMATGGGAAKFDGTNWTVYNPSNSDLPNEYIYSVAIDGNGNKWIGTDGYAGGGGIAKFNDTAWTVYTAGNSGLPDNWIIAIAFDGSGAKWIGTYAGIAKLVISSEIWVNVASPNNGEILTVGKSNKIQWNFANVINVKIEYTTDNGINWLNVISSTPASLNQYTWIVPNTPSTKCKIRISDATNSSISDVSDFFFAISTFPTNPCPGILTVTYEDKTYNTVKIGNQCWLRENLNVGAKINWNYNPSNNSAIEKYCYGDIETNCTIYGGLYQWNEAMQYLTTSGSQGICPPGWHIPTRSEFDTLKAFVNGDGNALKEIGQGVGAATGTNTSGFSALLAGGQNSGRAYYDLGSSAAWWGSTSNDSLTANVMTTSPGGSVIDLPNGLKDYSLSIRCLKDDNHTSSLILTSPTGGENWQVGTQKSILWTSSNITNVKIEYSTNNGTNWTTIIASTPASTGSYTWAIPNTPSTQCKVRISDVSNAAINDVSNAVFTIINPTVTVTSPNGGENWQSGSSHNITWTSNDIVNVNIEYSTNNGTTWISVVGSTPASSGSYAWTIPNTPSTNCKVMISEVVNSSVSDTSNSVFTIEPFIQPIISVVSPNGGEEWKVGDSKDIKWTSNGVANIKIEYSTNNGTDWINIVSNISSSLERYEWVIQNTPSTNCRVRVSDVSNPSLNDMSDNVFTVKTETQISLISLISPNGGEIFRAGSTVNIQWTSVNVNNVKIEYSTANTTGWTSIITSTSASQGVYAWNIPNTPSSNCKVRVSDTNNPPISDTSANSFIIFSYPANISINNSITFGQVTDISNYKILGYPGSIDTSINALIQGEPHYEWNAYWDNGDSLNYQIQYDGTDKFKFKPGKAFWLLSKNSLSLTTTVSSVELAGDFTFSIPLHNGWNLISNPFEKNVLWSAVQSANYGIQPIHDFNKTYSTASTFELYKGYYFNNITNLTSLRIPYPVTGTVPTLMNKNIGEEKAYISMWITGTEGEKTSVEIFNDLSGARGFDSRDIFAPPGDFEKLKISIRNNEIVNSYKYLFRDNRNLAEEEEIEVIIKNMTGNVVRLNIELPEKLIHEKVYLVEKSKGKFTDLLSEARVLISPDNPGDEFVLLLGSENFIESKKSEYLPKDFVLYQNYPNPFNPSTVISYQLPVNSRVSLKLFDILGNEVATIVDDEKPGGFYEVKFDASHFSSGVYFYQLRAGEFVSTKKLVFLK